MKIHCGGKTGIGDELTFTAVVREYKRAFPTEEIHIYQSFRDWIWKHNPHLWHGTTNNGKEYRPNTYAFLKASTAHGLAKDMGFHLVDDTPEIWLTEQEMSQDFGIPKGRTVAIDIGAMWPGRQWNPTNFIRVAELLRDDGWTVIEIGHRSNRDENLEPFRIPCDLSFLNKLQPRDNCAMLSKVDLLLGNDSGSMHMAAAVGTPQVAIFAAIQWYSRAYWNTTPVFPYSDCAPQCMERCLRQVKREDGRKHIDHCLEEIKPELVSEACRVAYNRFVVPGLRIRRPAPGRTYPMVPVGEPPIDW